MKLCKFQNSAVCSSLEYRQLFKNIFQIMNPDVYICPHAKYRVKGIQGNYNYIEDLYFVDHEKGKYWVTDIITSDLIFLSKDNFEIICCSEEQKCPDPFVQKFNVRKRE